MGQIYTRLCIAYEEKLQQERILPSRLIDCKRLPGLVGRGRRAPARLITIDWQSGKERLTMLSELELRSIIEGSFLPKRCECTKAEDASLTIKVYDEDRKSVV